MSLSLSPNYFPFLLFHQVASFLLQNQSNALSLLFLPPALFAILNFRQVLSLINLP